MTQNLLSSNRYTRLFESLERSHLKKEHELDTAVDAMQQLKSLRSLYAKKQLEKNNLELTRMDDNVSLGVVYLGNQLNANLDNSGVNYNNEDFYFLDTNNSGAPKADKHYDCPNPPKKYWIHSHPDHTEKRNDGREVLNTRRPDWITLYFRIRKRNYEDYLWQLFHEGRLKKSDVYTPAGLPFWTECIRFKIKKHINLGVAMRSLIARLGLHGNSLLRFCIDGFYGLEAYGDIFGNIGSGAVPWMEVNPSSTAESLRLEDGDMVFVCAANEKMLDLVEQRKLYLATQG